MQRLLWCGPLSNKSLENYFSSPKDNMSKWEGGDSIIKSGNKEVVIVKVGILSNLLDWKEFPKDHLRVSD